MERMLRHHIISIKTGWYTTTPGKLYVFAVGLRKKYVARAGNPMDPESGL